MDDPSSVMAFVVRVTRPNTILLRVFLYGTEKSETHYVVLSGVKVKKKQAVGNIIDWCELHSCAGKHGLAVKGWIRDSFGRLIGDLYDLQTGETLSEFLLLRGDAVKWPSQVQEAMDDLLFSQEPEDGST